jgi:hypothetical protein
MGFLFYCAVAVLSAMRVNWLFYGGHGPPYASRKRRAVHSNKNPNF